MERLGKIAYVLPQSVQSRMFLDQLRTLLAEVAYAESTVSVDASGGLVDHLTLTPPQPRDALPVTTFTLADVPSPEVSFDTGQSVGVCGANPLSTPTPAGVELADLARRLAGRVRRVDHTGVNLPASVTSPEQWRTLVRSLAAASTMYRYPTGEEWPFILPSTPDELHGDIRDFVVGREPRFELVYDQWLTQTTWQFALGTDLTRPALEMLFPEPEGTTLPGLEEIFRSVTVGHSWPGLGIRFDLYYRSEDGPSDWETGEWLITEGGRIH